MRSSIIIGGKSDEYKRHALDFYPTPVECTIALMDFLQLPRYATIHEPACGNGMMSKVLERYVSKVVSTDIRTDSGYGEGGIDFLKTREKQADACITNPPFDKSVDFILKCQSLGFDLYAMLLKSQYWHAKNRMGLFSMTKPTYMMPLTWRPNFAPERGDAPTIDVCWTVWVKGGGKTEYIPLQKPSAKLQTSLF